MVEFTLLTVLIPLFIGAAIGSMTKSIYVAGGISAVLLGWIAVQTREPFTVGAWLLLLLFMALGTGKKMTDMMLGDTA
jgi:hypothetical protein